MVALVERLWFMHTPMLPYRTPQSIHTHLQMNTSLQKVIVEEPSMANKHLKL